jgi:uncharacterized membrane protein YhaH (DUF805 family)
VNVLYAFGFSAALALTLAVLTVIGLRRSLDALLVEVCGTAGRAKFWTVFASMGIVLATLFGMMASFPLDDRSEWAAYPGVPVALAAFRVGLLFLLFALGGLGFALLVGIANYERRIRGTRQGPPPIHTTLQV